MSAKLRKLPPETWGRRLRRMREDVAGMNLTEATEAMAQFQLVSLSSVSRLEARTERPDDPRLLRTALLLCLVCGVDPAELDLVPKELVDGFPSVVSNALEQEFRAASTKWYSRRPGTAVA
jgi:hypothetical protein